MLGPSLYTFICFHCLAQLEEWPVDTKTLYYNKMVLLTHKHKECGVLCLLITPVYM